MLNTIGAEWIKLRTTMSFWLTSLLVVFFGVLFGALFGALSQDQELSTTVLLGGIYPFSMIVIVIQAVMIITTEYRFGYQTTTYLAQPRRWIVAIAKLLLYVLIGVILTFFTVVATLVIARLFKPDSTFNPFTDEAAHRAMWVFPATAAMVITLSQGVGLLLRQTAGAVSLVLMWFLLIETVLTLIPRIGKHLGDWAPFMNLGIFVNDSAKPDGVMNSSQAGWYFLAWAVSLWIIGLIFLIRRDA
ncbi:multidrug ABC transporter permease [Corynebacterium poyangense]|uniref:Multidrug ABC transporter permease n=1 Tax=Corynebacterium poyangense TaxID=2684405 RepID=A0A7H0SRB6_9CORY|nr:multidrug ABC transporter permease [Corynebacterium poyangense]MBZ8176525.1 multidrug ABC transporter permease [Corynebacterium poyangense]QNQ91091.1 multidrug ABC transporter permease [Corynebacterium poyangense]